MALDRDLVVSTALELLNEVGLDRLTTRRLAERLGVKQPALYWHFKNKRELLDEMAAQMLAWEPAPMTSATWVKAFKEDARAFRQTLLRYRDGARVHAGSRPDAATFPSLDRRVQVMCEAGFSAADAIRAFIVMSHYVVGAVLEEQTYAEATSAAGEKALSPDPDAYPNLARGVSAAESDGPARLFEFGLDALVAGIAAKIEQNGFPRARE